MLSLKSRTVATYDSDVLFFEVKFPQNNPTPPQAAERLWLCYAKKLETD